MTRMDVDLRTGLMFALGVALSSAVLVSVWGTMRGAVPTVVHLGVCVPALYFLCICVHDGVHGVLLRPRWLNQWAAGAFGCLLGMPFPLLQRAHLEHHRMVGRPDDPEHIIYSAAPWQLPWRLLLVPLYYLRSARRLSRPLQLATAAQLVGTAGVLAVGGAELAAAWLTPLMLAVGWFGFTTVYVPHSRYADRLMPWLNWHSGWHDDHHFDVRYPYPQYIDIRLWRIRHGLETVSDRELRVLQWLAADVARTPNVSWRRP